MKWPKVDVGFPAQSMTDVREIRASKSRLGAAHALLKCGVNWHGYST